MFSLSGKVAIVTGGASGIGYATAVTLSAAGADVVVADIDGDGASAVATEICEGGGNAVSCRVDVAIEADVEAMVDTAVHEFGRLDVLHNNAAATVLTAQDRDITSMTVDLWDQTMAVNLRGPMLGCKHAIPKMLDGGGGSIINTSSVSSIAGDLAYTAYGASKAGVNALTQYVATQYGRDNIRCNAVLPGLVLTELARSRFAPDVLEVYEYNHLTRLGAPTDIAHVVAFLASDASAFMTGQIIPVDGGQQSHISTYGHCVERGWNLPGGNERHQ